MSVRVPPVNVRLPPMPARLSYMAVIPGISAAGFIKKSCRLKPTGFCD